jgi:hypothetical protein
MHWQHTSLPASCELARNVTDILPELWNGLGRTVAPGLSQLPGLQSSWKAKVATLIIAAEGALRMTLRYRLS